jgi:hypothetical protein
VSYSPSESAALASVSKISTIGPASDYLRFKYNDNSYQEYRITTGKPKTCTTYGGKLDKGERKICKDDRVYYSACSNLSSSAN